jgi:hypothetical protein
MIHGETLDEVLWWSGRWGCGCGCGCGLRKLAPNKNLFPTFYREAGRICGWQVGPPVYGFQPLASLHFDFFSARKHFEILFVFVRLAVVGSWYWFFVREKYYWLIADWCWFGMRKKHCQLTDKLAEQNDCQLVEKKFTIDISKKMLCTMLIGEQT